MTDVLKPNEEFEPRECRAQSDGKRTFLKLGAGAIAALTIGGALKGAAAAADNRYFSLPVAPQNGAVDLGSGDTGILNYAFALEQLELAFLQQVLANPYAGMDGVERQLFTDLRDHELVHVEFFRSVLGSNAIPALQANFGKVKFNNRKSVLKTAQLLADTGVSAYNGAGKLLTDPNNLAIAGKIVSVEARHLSAINDAIKPLSGSFASSALDPAREPGTVLKLISPFVVTKISGANLPKA